MVLPRIALLLEEKAARLARNNPRRAELLQQAKAFRLLHLTTLEPEYQIERFRGSFAKRALQLMEKATSLPDGHPDRQKLLEKVEKMSRYNALEKLSHLISEDSVASVDKR